MKTTYRIISVLVASLCLLCACSSSLDEELTLNSYAPLTLSVSVGNYTPTGSGVQTRAANAYPFTFRNGDKLGIIALQGNGIVTNYNNIPFTYQDGKWASTPALPFSSAYQYLVYYPYQTEMTGKTSKADIIAAFTPKTDQSSEANHRASDLLVCDLITPAITEKTLNVTFEHALSLLVIPPVKATITSQGTTYQCGLPFTDARITAGTGTDTKDCSSYVASDGTARLIVKPQIDASLTSHFTYDNKSYSSSANNVTLDANYCYAFKELVTTFTYNFENAQVGDFYCNTTTTSGTTGYLIPNNAVSFPNDMECIGLVFRVGKDGTDDGKYTDRNNQQMSAFHGYVVALQDAGNAYRWANPIHYKVGTYATSTDWKGYSDCQKISAGGISKFPAANACITFGTAGSSSQYAAPTGSSGWFLPSCAQLLSLYGSSGLLSGQINKLKTISRYAAISWFLPVYYWSSSEVASAKNNARSVLFENGYMADVNNKGTAFNVRSILAF